MIASKTGKCNGHYGLFPLTVRFHISDILSDLMGCIVICRKWHTDPILIPIFFPMKLHWVLYPFLPTSDPISETKTSDRQWEQAVKGKCHQFFYRKMEVTPAKGEVLPEKVKTEKESCCTVAASVTRTRTQQFYISIFFKTKTVFS